MQVKEVTKYALKRRAFSLLCKKDDAPLLDILMRPFHPQEETYAFVLQNTQDTYLDKTFMRKSVEHGLDALKSDGLTHV
ncbi:hypothetical protein [Rhabdochlamydiaceae symbiont of Dictyostelium giganteum]|uniref:hypothetical protein n=1 Tax=Rhabdochlamydiaceae symbiont of Dictyostelium giganteum TaxID=3342349 RepID=UPI00384B24A6